MAVLRDEKNKEITDEKGILDLVHNYYASLYKQPTVTIEEKSDQARALTLIDSFVSGEDNARLMEVPDAEEIRTTVHELPLDKSPGEDGLPVEVLRELWEEIGFHCLEFVQEAWRKKRIGKSNTGAIIKLIPKNEKKDELKNWRPISLLNLAYKLVGRILAKRMKNIISRLVDEEQTGFVHGRSITDNIISLGLCQDLAVAQREPVLFCKLDFVKASD
ncbi:hypothetical protein R1flu_027764 [Riccia fluitans]|uniref:Reverse transcriptase domain-containing protein n=1 Tax=Riccia fluitans TaxID=41844 RepID=A0ABD1XMP7_9MARC